MFNLGSIFNTAVLGQANLQSANNIALGSAFTTQVALQGASNNAQIVQGTGAGASAARR
jgi:hypothetical protein